MTAAELEIALHSRDADTYYVDVRFSQPDSDADIRPASANLAALRIDRRALLQKSLDAIDYGRELAESLFHEAGVGEILNLARVAAAAVQAPLRIRLYIAPSAPELQSLRWETLLDPTAQTPLLTNENIVFSRYLSSFDWRPVRLRPQRELSALTVIAHPKDVADYGLAAIDVGQEQSTAMTALGKIRSTNLTEPGSATLYNIVYHLRDGVDILYLVAHGALKKGEPTLYLEDDGGKTDPVLGSELATRLRELSVRPRLVVLASCQSAGTGTVETSQDEGALAALGPRLAEVGVPAVLAMQGNVTMDTVHQFMPVFFRELGRDGQVDRAMAVARSHVRDRADWWMPVLYLRLKAGRIWYVPGFDERQDPLEKWEALLESIRDAECTPILGPGLTEYLYGSSQDLATRLAEMHRFPLAPHEREDLTLVAQYLSVKQSRRFLTASVLRLLASEIQRIHASLLPVDLANRSLEKASTKELVTILAELIRSIAEGRQTTMVAEPFQTLARLPFPIYITTDISNLLVDALRDAGKSPEVELLRWNQDMERLPSVYEDEPEYRPSVARPLVYHLFGHIEYPRSLVLTEDDYFDYLIGATSNKDLIPARVRSVLADTALLFLGFQMEDRNFRVIFRGIMSQQGSVSLGEYDAHVAAQVTPEEGRLLEPVSAQEYLEEYFQQNGHISIYWGDPETFVKDLYERWDWAD